MRRSFFEFTQTGNDKQLSSQEAAKMEMGV